MPIARTLRNLLCAGALIVVLGAAAASAQDYPTRPITLVVPFPPGGSTTIVARIVADRMSEALGQSIIIDNRGGAGGTVGSRALAKSPADGYAILLGYTGTLAIGPTLYGNAGYDPRADFAPIGRIGTAPNTLVVHPSLPVHSVAELIAYAKANPGKINYGSAGIGTVSHVCGEYFATAAGVRITHIPYKGFRHLNGAPLASTDLKETLSYRHILSILLNSAPLAKTPITGTRPWTRSKDGDTHHGSPPTIIAA